MSSKSELAIAAATAAAPEVAIPAEILQRVLASKVKAKSDRQQIELNQGSTVVVIPPEEHPPLIKLGKDKIRVVVKQGVRIVTVERARGITAKELVELAALGAIGVGGYEVYRWVKGGPVSKNAIGIPFGNRFGGGGVNPLNYIFP